MKNTKLNLLLLMITILFSCNDDMDSINEQTFKNPYEKSGKLEIESKEIVRNAVLELVDLQKEIHKNQAAFMEIYHLTDNTFYVDNYCSLSDLLNPSNAEVYKRSKVPMRFIGEYKKAFDAELQSNLNQYPNLNFITNSVKIRGKNAEFNIEDFYANADLTFYIPYKSNDNEVIIDPYNGTTYVPGVIDAIEGLGYKYNSDTEEFDEVMTNDDYANAKMSVIIEPNDYRNLLMHEEDINSGGGSGYYNPQPNEYTGDCDKLPANVGEYLRQVWVGYAKINNKKQYDRFISFTGNGGGSEIRIGRLDSRDQISIDSIGNISANQWDNIVSIDFSRKDIRKKRKKWVGSIWHENWECNDGVHEVLLGIYEEDTEGDVIFDQTINWEGEEIFSVDATIQNRSKDEIIRKIIREEDEFFITNLLDQGCGAEQGEYSFSDRQWSWYDCGTDFKYTMPHRWVPIN